MIRDRMLYHFKRAIFKLSPGLAEKLGFDFRMNIPDRVYLEKQIFGFVNAHLYGTSDGKLLCIGVKKYNWHCPRLLNCECQSIYFDMKTAAYGIKGKHIFGSALSLSDYYMRNSFSFVVATGVVGFGINDEFDFVQMLSQIYTVLRGDGILILGYNNEPERLTFDIEKTYSFSLYDRYTPPITGLTKFPHEIKNSSWHCYVFLKKARDI